MKKLDVFICRVWDGGGYDPADPLISFCSPHTYLVEVVHCSGIPTTRHSVLANSLQNHTLLDALFETTVLTPISLGFRDFAGAFRNTGVHSPVLHRPLEETLASATINIIHEKRISNLLCRICTLWIKQSRRLPFARDDAIMQTRRFVLANHADHRLFFLLMFLGLKRRCRLRLRRWFSNVTIPGPRLARTRGKVECLDLLRSWKL